MFLMQSLQEAIIRSTSKTGQLVTIKFKKRRFFDNLDMFYIHFIILYAYLEEQDRKQQKHSQKQNGSISTIKLFGPNFMQIGL